MIHYDFPGRLLEWEVENIAVHDGRVTGVQARQRRTGARLAIDAPIVISNLGPAETLGLCGINGGGTRSATSPPEASGFKIQLLSPVSLVPHRSVRDLSRISGSVLDACSILSAGRFTAGWPVNRAIQGQDARTSPPVLGLHWVGDAYKPAGYMMVEGIAESVRRLTL